jgi:hypothetical protein
MRAETVPETSVIFNQQTQLTAQEDFIKFRYHGAFICHDVQIGLTEAMEIETT